MFTGYNLKIDRNFFNDKSMSFDCYQNIGEKHLNGQIDKYKNNLTKYIHKGTINGSELQDDNFPIINADIFISHSHDDEGLANALAGWIHSEFGLKVFIDSNVWNYSQELLEDINSKYSNKRKNEDGGIIFDYEAGNYASQHVNIMLSVALQKMIDKVECVMLLNTDNSITVFDDTNQKMNSTYSPWIYSEIVCTQIVRKKPLLYYRKYDELYHADEGAKLAHAMRKLQISYNISLQHLTDMNEEELEKWKITYEGDLYNDYKKYPLDALYQFKHPNEYEYTKTLSHHFSYDCFERLKSFIDGNADSRYIHELFEQAVLCENRKNICSICKGERCKFNYERKNINE